MRDETYTEFMLAKMPDTDDPEIRLAWVVQTANTFGRMIADTCQASEADHMAFVLVTHYMAGRSAGILLAEQGDDAESHAILHGVYHKGLGDGREAFQSVNSAMNGNAEGTETKQ